jgi:hypothetical protein
MLKTGLSHGIAIMPAAPKTRYTDPKTGAHFDFGDISERIEAMAKKRAIKYSLSDTKVINKDFFNKVNTTTSKDKPTFRFSNNAFRRKSSDTE